MDKSIYIIYRIDKYISFFFFLRNTPPTKISPLPLPAPLPIQKRRRVSIVEEERDRRRGPDGPRPHRGWGMGLPPRRRPEGWRACVSPLIRGHVSGPPADV